MQPHRHFNELDHWRNTSQRLNTSSPSDSAPPPLSTLDISQEEPRDRQHDGEPSAPLNEQTAMEDNEARNSSSDLFPIESSRGWLEYAPVEIAPTASKSLDRNRASERGGDDMSTNFGSRVQHMHSELPTTSDSQKAKDMLCAVSDEDILKLTQMASQLPSKTGEPRTHPHYQQQQRQSVHSRKHHAENHTSRLDHASDEQTRSRLNLVSKSSVSTEDLGSGQQGHEHQVIAARPSVSTPPPSKKQQQQHAKEDHNRLHRASRGNDSSRKQEHRLSWYKSLIKRDKGKGKLKATELDQDNFNESEHDAFHVTDVSGIRSNPSTVDDGSPGSSSMIRGNSNSSSTSSEAKRFASAHMVPMQIQYSNQSSAASPGHNTSAENTTVILPDQVDGRRRASLRPAAIIKDKLLSNRAHRRTSSAAVPYLGDSNNDGSGHDTIGRKTSSPMRLFGFRNRRHSFDSVRSTKPNKCVSADPLHPNKTSVREHQEVDGPELSELDRLPSDHRHPLSVLGRDSPIPFSGPNDYANAGNMEHSEPSALVEPLKAETLNVPGSSHAIRPSFDLYFSRYGERLQSSDIDGNGSEHIYPSGSEEGIKSSRSSLSGHSTKRADRTATETTKNEQELGNKTPFAGTTMLFDYDTLPDEVLSLLREYEKQGKMEIVEKRVVHYSRESQDSEDEEDEEEDDDEDALDASKLLTTAQHHFVRSDSKRGGRGVVRKIAVVHADKADKAEFVKLVQFADNHAMGNGTLIDLRVSMFGENEENSGILCRDETRELLKSIDDKIKALQKFTQDSKQFLEDNKETIEYLALDDIDRPISDTSPRPTPGGSRQISSRSIISTKDTGDGLHNHTVSNSRRPTFSIGTPPGSSPSISSNSSQFFKPLSSGRYRSSSVQRSGSLLLDPYLPYNTLNPYDYRQEEVVLGVHTLQNETAEFTRALEETENLIRDIQADVQDTRRRMTLYIKDIPEEYYSALKKLEVDIESILANRAKNPWLDTGYTLLSYVLTVFALLVWIIICFVKWIRTIVLFPKRLWRTYSEYLVERNQAVKKASLKSVSSNVDLPSEGTSRAFERQRQTLVRQR